MTPEQLGILNRLVTFAAENIPGGLSEDEREVAKIVGAAALLSHIEAVQEPKEARLTASEAPTQVIRPKRYAAVFAGKSDNGEKIVIYKALVGDQLYLRYGDGGVWALEQGSQISRWETGDGRHHIRITSPVWSGTASGTNKDLLTELARY